MIFTTLVDVEAAREHLTDADWVFVDCRAALGRPTWGREQYEHGHIPGAVHADLERDLSGAIIPGKTGRHPLPAPEAFDAFIGSIGIGARTQVVAYDAGAGAMAAARLWWLLRWAGHDAVAVLNGGLAQWQASGYPVLAGSERRAVQAFAGRYQAHLIADSDQILSSLPEQTLQLIDVRAGERYRGESEPIDPVSGHIPGARSAPYDGSLTADGTFLPADVLRRHFDGVIRAAGPEPVVFYCGSGVTAAHSALAYAHAGFDMPRLYPGSWSEWISDPNRPRA